MAKTPENPNVMPSEGQHKEEIDNLLVNAKASLRFFQLFRPGKPEKEINYEALFEQDCLEK